MMAIHRFQLVPFEDVQDIAIKGTLEENQGIITARYRVEGNLRSISVAEWDDRAGRRDALWVTTCFEMFLAPFDSKNYWEFNFSSSGAWNAYHFDDYRENILPEERIEDVGLMSDVERSVIQLEAQVPVSALGKHHFQVGVSVVLDHGDNQLSHWALIHPHVDGAPQADFHNRKTFTIML